jgi:hypothetical protein
MGDLRESAATIMQLFAPARAAGEKDCKAAPIRSSAAHPGRL